MFISSRLSVLITILCLVGDVLSQDVENSSIVVENGKNDPIIITEVQPSTTIRSNFENKNIPSALSSHLFLGGLLVLGLVVVMSLLIPLVSIMHHRIKSKTNLPYAIMV